MEKDLDIELYNTYLEGEKSAFELLYNKYKDKVQYFVYNIVKDYQKAEDITQEVFIYVLQNKMKNGYSFKYYIYLIAKSKALNYISSEKRKMQIHEQYFSKELNQIQDDVIEFVTKNETQKELIEAISLLDDKYRNAIYLVKIAEFSYKETADILGETVQNIKNLIHRGKRDLRKILIKKGFDEMNKVSKISFIVLCMCIILSGVAYATMKIVERTKQKANLTPSFTSSIGDNDINSVWVGSFQIAWNEFMDKRVKGKVEFDDGKSQLVDELNKRLFTKEMLSSEDYHIKVGQTSNELRTEILNEINNKFGISTSSALNQINFDVEPGTDSYTIYSILYKNFTFKKSFDRLYAEPFNNSRENNNKEIVKYFGINNASSEDLNSNVKVLFYNNRRDFAVKLETQENEDVILYYNNTNSSFNNLYEEVKQKTNSYKGNTEFSKDDELKVPYINVDTIINYGELCGRTIKGTKGLYIANAIQNVKFSLNEKGGNLLSEAIIRDIYMSINEETRYFYYTEPFVIFLKESDKDNPYFALKVDDMNVLVKSSKEENVIPFP